MCRHVCGRRWSSATRVSPRTRHHNELCLRLPVVYTVLYLYQRYQYQGPVKYTVPVVYRRITHTQYCKQDLSTSYKTVSLPKPTIIRTVQYSFKNKHRSISFLPTQIPSAPLAQSVERTSHNPENIPRKRKVVSSILTGGISFCLGRRGESVSFV